MSPNPPELDELRNNLSTTLYENDRPIEMPRRRSWLRSLLVRSPIATAGTAAVGLAGVGIAVAATVSGGVTPAQFHQGQRAQPAASVPSAAAASFSALSGSVTAADALPASYIATHKNSPLVGELGANLSLAHRVPGVSPGEAWVVPTDSGVCLIVSQYGNGQITGAACTGESAAEAGRLVLRAGSPDGTGGEFIAGLVPNGVSQVALGLADGSTKTLPVHANVYTSDDTSSAPSSLAFSGPSGAATTFKMAAGS